jgi:hypothetical protein
MKKKVTDDPQFHWWEREVSNIRLELDPAVDPIDEATSTWTVLADPFGFGGGEQCKANDILLVEQTGELVRVTAASSTSITVAREWQNADGTGTDVNSAFDVDGNAINPYLLIVGNVNEEGADTPESIRYRPTKHHNFTEIFRDSLKATRTAMQTRLRTVDEVRDAKTQSLLYHTMRMEYAFILGARIETVGAGTYPMRSTGGIISFLTSGTNDIDENGTALEMERYEELDLEIFRFGSNEKMCFCGNRAMMAFQQMARRNASLEITPAQKEFGMDVRRFFTPGGTLVLKTHPLFNQVKSQIDVAPGTDTFYGMDSWALILDMGNITYRPLRGSDTQYLPDRQGNGIDGLTSEYLTEAGLEVNHANTHFLIRGLVAGTADA